MSEKTPGQVAYDQTWRQVQKWKDVTNEMKRHWEDIAAAAVVAHVSPQIEAEARAAAVEEAANDCELHAGMRGTGAYIALTAQADRIRAIASAPPGYVCVPVEPTPEMITAGEYCEWPREDIYGCKSKDDCRESATEIYKAMLAAARQK